MSLNEEPKVDNKEDIMMVNPESKIDKIAIRIAYSDYVPVEFASIFYNDISYLQADRKSWYRMSFGKFIKWERNTTSHIPHTELF